MSENRTPSPWEEPAILPDSFKEEYAFSSSAFPPNSIPFITRLRQILDENYTNSLQTLAEGRELQDTSREKGGWQARAVLWILNAQYFGLAADIDMHKEWVELDKAHKAGKF